MFCQFAEMWYLCTAFQRKWALSSAGSELLPYKQRVGGSNPSAPTKHSFLLICNLNNGRIAQLVQSICLTSRGSAVRIRQRPPHLFMSVFLELVFESVSVRAAAFLFLYALPIFYKSFSEKMPFPAQSFQHNIYLCRKLPTCLQNSPPNYSIQF